MGDKLRAILVDDEESARNILSNLLKRYEDNILVVDTCEDVPSAVASIQQHKPDVVFLDIMQFHVRDAASADEDLRDLLAASAGSRPAGALVFTCNGRGMRLFDEPHHDARCVRECLGSVPTAGFFAQGEIGPIGDRTFLHGFTASIAIVEAVPE